MLGAVTTMRRRHGFTLVEAMIVIAVAGVILVLAAPSLRDLILMQRLRGVNSQLVTDLQFARAEAVARRSLVGVALNDDTAMTCYVIYQIPDRIVPGEPRLPCDCRRAAGTACAEAPRMVEIRTVQVQRDLGVYLAAAQGAKVVGFDPTTGGIMRVPSDAAVAPRTSFKVNTYIDTERTLQTQLNTAGRTKVCKPPGSALTEEACS